MPSFQSTACSVTSSMNTFYFAWSLPSRESQSSSNHPCLGCRWTSLIKNFNSSRNMLNHRLHLDYNRFIMASMCIFKHFNSWPPSSYTSKLIVTSKSISEPVWPTGVLAYLETNSTTTSKCIAILARLHPHSWSPSILQYHLQVHHQDCLNNTFKLYF